MAQVDVKQYAATVVYGIGQYYESIKADLLRHVRPDYLCDGKWENGGPDSYGGIPVIKKEDLFRLDHVLVIVAVSAPWLKDRIKSELEANGLPVVHVDDIIGKPRELTGAMLKELYPGGVYQDFWGNCIYFDRTIPDPVRVTFFGKNNVLTLGHDMTVSRLSIVFGTGGVCDIGDNAEIFGAYFAVSGARVKIGKEALFSTEVVLRTHDGHHIFDADTHKRVNVPKDIILGDHVWVGYRAILLPGAQIGRGSVVGAGAVTAGQFGEHLILAGTPAKVIRENICWSRDDPDYFNYDILEEGVLGQGELEKQCGIIS